MIIEIGIVAGEIWHALESKESSTVATLADEIGRERDVVLLSLGWLAREGHVTMSQTGESYVVNLNQKV